MVGNVLRDGRERHLSSAVGARHVRLVPSAPHPDRDRRRGRTTAVDHPSIGGRAGRVARLARGDDGRYEIGRRIWDLGALAAVSRELRETAWPFMQDLAATTGENVHVAVLEGTNALFVDRIAGQSSPRRQQTGARLPLHATGVGKVLLANADPEVLREYLAACAESPGTPSSNRNDCCANSPRSGSADTRRPPRK